MEIKKETDGKWFFPSYGNFLVNASAKEDVDKVIVQQVFCPLTESNDSWEEITAEEKDRIISAKLTAKGQLTSINESVNNTNSLLTASVNSFGLSAEKALQFKSIFPKWETDVIGEKLEVGFRFQYREESEQEYDLWEVIQEHTAQAQYPPSADTGSLYKRVQIEHEGTLDDPIPYKQMMALELGKYYIQYDVIYKCIQATGTGMPYDLKDMAANATPVEQ